MLDDGAGKARPDDLEPLGETPGGQAQAPIFGSLMDDVGALIEDGKTYAEAELAFQKTRAAYAAQQTRRGVVHALAALAFLHLALIALVVGLVIALGPYLTPFGATAAVTGALLIGVAIFARKALKRARAVGSAFGSGDDEHA